MLSARKVLPIVAMALLLISFTHAAPNEATLSGSYTKNDAVQSYELGGSLGFPLGDSHFLLGPSIDLQKVEPADGESTYGALAGVLFELNLGENVSGPFVALEAQYAVGDLADHFRYQASALAGLKQKIGTGAFIKAWLERTRRFDVDNSPLGDDETRGVLAIGAAWS